MSSQDAGRTAREEAFFDALARQQSDSWWGHKTHAGKRRQVRRAKLIADILAPVEPETRILEIGCGAGDFTVFLMEQLPRCRFVGMDISGQLLELARQRIARPDVEFRKGDVQKIDPSLGLFDAVIGASILHHLDASRALAALHEALRPGGKLAFMEPNMRNPQVWLERNVRLIGKALQNTEDETAFHRQQMSRMLHAAGFVDVCVTPFDFLHPLVPRALVAVADRLLRMLERVPLIKELAGSLLITASRAGASDKDGGVP